METLPHASSHATLNAILNALSATFLLTGWIRIKRYPLKWKVHRNIMLVALAFSAAFLASYLLYHYNVGSVKYPFMDWTRSLYFAILIPHVILAALMVPFIIMLLFAAFRNRFERHKAIARWVWPVWMFVSVSGVVVYLMLYRPWL